MMQERITMYLEIPEEVLLSLKVPKRDTERCLRVELAIRLYERGLLGFGKARELACMTKWEFHELLAKEGILRSYDEEEFEKDLKTLETLEK